MEQIRCMTMADYDAVYDLWLHTPGMGLNTLDDSREGIAQYLLRNPATCFVAEAQGRLVGVIMAGHDGRRGWIYHTAVLPAYRHQGIGRRLTERALAALAAEGISKVALVAFAHNQAGNAFWETLGFSERTDLVYRNKSLREAQRMDT